MTLLALEECELILVDIILSSWIHKSFSIVSRRIKNLRHWGSVYWRNSAQVHIQIFLKHLCVTIFKAHQIEIYDSFIEVSLIIWRSPKSLHSEPLSFLRSHCEGPFSLFHCLCYSGTDILLHLQENTFSTKFTWWRSTCWCRIVVTNLLLCRQPFLFKNLISIMQDLVYLINGG